MNFEEAGYKVRFAEPSDAPDFVKWATENPKIDPRDLEDSMKANNPTCVVLVVEKDGKPILFAPFYCHMMLCYLGFNPDGAARERVSALEIMKRAMEAFAKMHGIREIGTLTSADQTVAKWAYGQGFHPEPRQLYRLRLEESAHVL